MHTEALVSQFSQDTGLTVREGIPASRCTTYAIGGPIQYLIEPNTIEELQRALFFLGAQGECYRVLGSGSNLLVSSLGIQGWVIRLGPGFRTIRELGLGHFEVGASYSLMALSREMSERGYSGLEFAGGIPASLGGAVVMNAGAHGHEICSVLRQVTIVNEQGEVQVLERGALNFVYRHCELAPKSIVLSLHLSLTAADPCRIAAARQEFLAERKRKQPLTLPSAGSVFKNPSKSQTAGALIEQVGLKGFQKGGVKISELHANWIVNEFRQASHADVLGLVSVCQERVLKQCNIELVPELVFWC